MANMIYSEDNMKVILFYVIIPLLVILFLFFLITKIYNLLSHNKDKNRTNYVINYWSNALGVIVSVMLLSVSIGFFLALNENIKSLNLANNNSLIYFLYAVFPIIPLCFLIYYIYRFVNNIIQKEKLEDKEDRYE